MSRSLVLLVSALLLPATLLPSCGLASRARFASLDIGGSGGSPEVLEEVRGAEPLLPGIWSYSVAQAARSESPEETLGLLDKGLSFQPRDFDLLLMRVNILMGLGRVEEGREAIAVALTSMPPPPVEAWLRAALIGDFLDSGDVDGAETETLVLGSVSGVSNNMVAAAWAQVALSAEILGQRERADVAMDHSLDRGSGARAALLEATTIRPERMAADRGLRRRAAMRHPGNVDMALSLVVDQMIAGEFAEAEAAVSDLPAPVPARLAHEIFALHARLVLMQGRTEEGLELLRDQLFRSPDNSFAIDVLLEAWLQRGEFQDREVYDILERSWRSLRPGPARTRIETVLQELHTRIERAKREEGALEVGPLPPTNG